MKNIDELMKKSTSAFKIAREQVLALYEENDGEPNRDRIECPMCEVKTLNYACDWYGNKHVHLYCNSCEWTIMQ